MSDSFLTTRYDAIVYVILLQETCQSILFLPVHHLNFKCRNNVSYSGHSWKSMTNCVKYRFSINLQLFSVVLKSVPVKYITTYCPWDSHQIHSSCTSMNLWWQNNPSLWLSWSVSIPKWVSYSGMPPVPQVMPNFWRTVYVDIYSMRVPGWLLKPLNLITAPSQLKTNPVQSHGWQPGS